MSVIVTDAGFGAEDWTGGVAALADWPSHGAALDVPPDAGLAALDAALAADVPALIRVDFPSSADGRGFTLARHLRETGYGGRLRASGHVLADQYAMARRAGFDEVEIDDALAARQPEAQWRARADWRRHDYRSKLGARPSPAAR